MTYNKFCESVNYKLQTELGMSIEQLSLEEVGQAYIELQDADEFIEQVSQKLSAGYGMR